MHVRVFDRTIKGQRGSLEVAMHVVRMYTKDRSEGDKISHSHFNI